MPIHPDSIKTPVNLVPKAYVPANGHKYPVQLGDSWATLAAKAGVGPWDLIRYNYPRLPADIRESSKEVNWYLENYVGCKLLTPDQRNYRFSPPGEIWIPDSPDEIATKLVLDTLRHSVVRRMTFGIGSVAIQSSYYEDIAKAIEAGKIAVGSDRGLTGLAIYHGGSKPAVIRISPGLSDLGLIVHEATHAIFDMLKLTTNVGQSEGFGYVSQALYNLLRFGPSPRYVVPFHSPAFSWISWQIIFDESKRLAETLRIRYWVPEDEAAALFKVFLTTRGGGYESRTGVETNDGL